jgi:hypothetical protein
MLVGVAITPWGTRGRAAVHPAPPVCHPGRLAGCPFPRSSAAALTQVHGQLVLHGVVPPNGSAPLVETLEDALARHGKPDIFNTDQGSQFTGSSFTGLLASHGIAISMDGKGAWRDNVFVEAAAQRQIRGGLSASLRNRR